MTKTLIVIDVYGLSGETDQAAKIKDSLVRCQNKQGNTEIIISFDTKPYKTLCNENKVLCTITGLKWPPVKAVAEELRKEGFSVLAKAIAADYV